MPEFKHTFQAGKMNKDLDERLIPNGEYRHAENIQVRTTDSGDDGTGAAGTVQNIQSNSIISSFPGFFTSNDDLLSQRAVGSIADEKNDVAYFFMAGLQIDDFSVASATMERLWIDSIYEQHVDGIMNPVVVDVYAISNLWGNVQGNNGQASSPNIPSNESIQNFPNWYRLLGTTGSCQEFRIGMSIQIYDSNLEPLLVENTKIIGLNVLQGGVQEIVLNNLQSNSNVWQEGQYIIVKMNNEDRLLNFNQENLITAINIIDDLLIWTDGHDEPRKINITNCKAGSIQWAIDSSIFPLNFTTHTRLFVKNPLNGELVNINEIENITDDSLKKEHITVIKRAPKTAPNIIMSNSDRTGETLGFSSYAFVGDQFEVAQPNVDIVRENITINGEMDYRVGDALVFRDASNDNNIIVLRGVIVEIEFDGEDTIIDLKMTFKDPDVMENNTQWEVTLQQGKPLFELKLGRFAYRYKYEDGEYSTFSPWSELAFQPGEFMYTPSKGYNMGMVNTIRLLTIKDFIPSNSTRPSDVKTIDILFKTTDDSNVYVVKSITREIDSEWELFTESEYENTGSITLTSEMIHKVLESDQTLRAWDNVPRKAIAQEIVGNRLLYGNYTQGYELGKV